ncbi:MAG: putative sulfate exporter family transporter [Propioniciclava sp.]|uniref:YeiH family protein n=1 Tax=Propioniciclava sp. TaxID=2038686 RepID=UPI0039E5E011
MPLLKTFPRPSTSPTAVIAPGLALCLAAAGVAYLLTLLLPGVSPLILAITFGALAANALTLPAWISPGVAFSSKKLLRAGIVLLGLKLALTDIVGLGLPLMVVIVCIVAAGITGTVLIGRALKVPEGLTLLIACGFSICGAAAVAAVAGVTDPDERAEEDTVTAVALVVVFGTLMIPLLPLFAGLLGLDSVTAGLWAGGSLHEVAQVVATGEAIGGSALAVAVVVKLGRVLLLAPVAAVLSVRERQAVRGTRPLGGAGDPGRDAGSASGQVGGTLPPLVPVFVVGFVAIVGLRSFVPLPPAVPEAGALAQTWLLSAAMFALGCGIKVRTLTHVGIRPFVLAALSTVLVSVVALVGVLLATH